MCCCWLRWWWHGRSRWSFCCVEGALWRLLWLRQRKASWKLPPNSKLKSRSDTHPHLAKLHSQTEAWEQLTSGKARIYSVLKISRLQYLFTDHPRATSWREFLPSEVRWKLWTVPDYFGEALAVSGYSKGPCEYCPFPEKPSLPPHGCISFFKASLQPMHNTLLTATPYSVVCW